MAPSKPAVSNEHLPLDVKVERLFTQDSPYCPVLIMEDGKDPKDPSTKCIKLDLADSVKRYFLVLPPDLSQVPQEQRVLQSHFYQRAYKEMLEKCTELLLPEVTREGSQTSMERKETIEER